MADSEAVWLVEIRLKDWEPDLPGRTRIVSFEEVAACDEIAARHAGFDQFAARCNYEPVMRRKMLNSGNQAAMSSCVQLHLRN